MILDEMPIEYKHAVTQACKDTSVKLMLETNWDVNIIEKYLAEIYAFLLELFKKTGTKQIALLLDPTPLNQKNDEGDELTTTIIHSFFNQGFNLFQIDSNLKLTDTSNINSLSLTKCSELSSKNPAKILIQVLNGININLFLNGKIIAEDNVKHPLRGSFVPSKFNKEPIDYKASILECYNSEFRFSGGPNSVWSNKKERLLKGGHTEQLFHYPLFKWLDMNIVLGKVTRGEKKVSDDETDIEISSLRGGETYLLEVKWTGENENNTKFSEPKIKEGITQVINYMQLDPKLTEACLITFDGRSIEEFDKLECVQEEKRQFKVIKKCLGKEFPENAEGHVFFLESESASKRQN